MCRDVVVMAARKPSNTEADNDSLEYGLGAIESLAAGSAANQTLLGELGACAGECMREKLPQRGI